MKQFTKKESDYWTSLHKVWGVLEDTDLLYEIPDPHHAGLTCDEHMETLSEALTELAAWRKRGDKAKALQIQMLVEEAHEEARMDNVEFEVIYDKFGKAAALQHLEDNTQDFDKIVGPTFLMPD